MRIKLFTILATLSALIASQANAAEEPTKITIKAAVYGSEQVEKKSTPRALSDLIRLCNGKVSCSYLVDAGVLGDPEPGIRKRFIAQYTCGERQLRYSASLSGEAHGQTVVLSCAGRKVAPEDDLAIRDIAFFVPGFYTTAKVGTKITEFATLIANNSKTDDHLMAVDLALLPLTGRPDGVRSFYGLLGGGGSKKQYRLARMAENNGRILLQFDGGTWCHIRTPQQLNLINGDATIVSSLRPDAPSETLMPCAYPDGFYKFNDSPEVFMLHSPARFDPSLYSVVFSAFWYNLAFGSEYCLVPDVAAWKRYISEAGLSSSNPQAYLIRLDRTGNNIAEGRAYGGIC